ncbi:MAG: ABC transporter permease [Firmicutes bacterium]|nr:ABC transporter permease [Bacillota bacterium]
MRWPNWQIVRAEVHRNIVNKRFIALALITQACICFTLIAIVVANTVAAYTGTEQFRHFIGEKSYYTLNDLGDQDGSFAQYMDLDAEEPYMRLRQFVNELRQNEEFSFISTIIQPLRIEYSPDMPDRFLYGYEEGDAREPAPLDDLDGALSVSQKAVHICPRVLDEFGITVAEGREFTNSDFALDSERVSVILGSEYREFYALGDTFKGLNLFEPMSFEVIGFLPEDTAMPVRGALFFLDRYILVPAFANVDLNQYPTFARITLSQQANGQIVIGDADLDVPRHVDRLSMKYNTFSFDVAKVDDSNIMGALRMSEAVLGVLLRIALVLILFTIVSLSASVLGYIRENYFRYGVHLMSGGSVTDILYQVLGTIGAIVGTALCLSLLTSLVFLGVGLHLLTAVLSALVVLVGSSIVPIVLIARLDVNSLLRRPE